MTDTQPIQDGAQNNQANDAGASDDPQNRDSLQQQARKETSKAEGERSSFQDENGDQTDVSPEGSTQGDPAETTRGQGQDQAS